MVNIKTKPIQQDKEREPDEWKNKYLRALADYQNLERRMREKEFEDKKYATREVIQNFLPVIDDLVKAQEQIKNEGLKLIIDKIDTVLKKEQVERKDCLNQKYDEKFMECVSIVESDKDNIVIGQVRPGYIMNGEVIRAAQVVVSKKKEEVKKEDEKKV